MIREPAPWVCQHWRSTQTTWLAGWQRTSGGLDPIWAKARICRCCGEKTPLGKSNDRGVNFAEVRR
jgi:hypothetical protein